jgi:hypothetical protein
VRNTAIALIPVVLLAGCTSGATVESAGDFNSTVAAPTYASCADLNLDYLGGISRTGAENNGPLPLFEWLEDDILFDANSDLDADGDGIACELLVLTDDLRTAHETPELSSLLELKQALGEVDFPRVGQKCGSLEGTSSDTIGYSQKLEFIILRCDQNNEWQPRFDANGQEQFAELDSETGFPASAVKELRRQLETTVVATQKIDVPINPLYQEGSACGGGYGWQVLGYNKAGEPSFLKCPNGNGTFIVDNDAYKIDPVSLFPQVPTTLRPYQPMAYSPHVYIIPEISEEVPSSKIDDYTQFSSVEPCKVKDLDESPDKSFGFPLPASSAILKPGFKVLVLPVQFPDFPSANNPQDDIADVRIELTRYYERMASNEISFEWTIPNTYLPMKKKLTDYNLAGQGDFFDYYVPYIQDVVSAYDNEFDFSEFDIVVVEEPRTVTDKVHPMYVPAIRGNGNFRVSSDEGPVTRVLITGNDEIRDIPNWLHEFGHLLGLPDRNWQTGGVIGFDLMFGWYGSPELSIWLRWLLGIASDDQIACVTGGESSTHWIRPVAWDGSYLKGVVIPVDSSTVLVAESRRRLGYDALAGESGEGVFIYRIDTSARMYRPDSRIIVDSVRPERATITQNDWSFDSPLKPGEAVVSDGWEISVLESGTFGDVVQVRSVGE